LFVRVLYDVDAEADADGAPYLRAHLCGGFHGHSLSDPRGAIQLDKVLGGVGKMATEAELQTIYYQSSALLCWQVSQGPGPMFAGVFLQEHPALHAKVAAAGADQPSEGSFRRRNLRHASWKGAPDAPTWFRRFIDRNPIACRVRKVWPNTGRRNRP